jgi:rSAM-associated Gly-rich repeat protein
MTSGSNNSKRSTERSLARSLGALFAVTGSLMLSSAGAADAAATHTDASKADGTEPLEIRVQKVHQQLGQGLGTEVNQGDPSSPQAQPMWWGNWHNWHPGWGWQNWHPGWGNGGWGNAGWGNGGWHNWHNWHNWGNW